MQGIGGGSEKLQLFSGKRQGEACREKRISITFFDSA